MLQELLDNLLSSSNKIKLGLDNIQRAAKILNLQKPAPYIITIAGTNGKGSVITLLEQLFVALGYNTGCYTSPHLVLFNERVRINQANITDQELIDSFTNISVILKANQIELTFFEFITLSAWQIFSQKNLDILLLEIGLGGRLDAVNAIPKDLAIITSVDYDHQEYLGNDLETIGFEKAGIITDCKPVIYGDDFMPKIISEIAKERNSELHKFGHDYNLILQDNNLIFENRATKINLELEQVSHSIRLNNIATSLKALSIYLELNNSKLGNVLDIVKDKINNLSVTGRCSWLDKNKTILLDVAHNPQAVKNLNDYLNKLNLGSKKIIAIFGMFKDKDIAECMRLINHHISHWYLCGTQIEYPHGTNNKRGTTAKELAEILATIDADNDADKKYSCFDYIEQCCHTAFNFLEQNSDNNSILIIFGSFHIVGPAYEIYTKFIPRD